MAAAVRRADAAAYRDPTSRLEAMSTRPAATPSAAGTGDGVPACHARDDAPGATAHAEGRGGRRGGRASAGMVPGADLALEPETLGLGAVTAEHPASAFHWRKVRIVSGPAQPAGPFLGRGSTLGRKLPRKRRCLRPPSIGSDLHMYPVMRCRSAPLRPSIVSPNPRTLRSCAYLTKEYDCRRVVRVKGNPVPFPPSSPLTSGNCR
jgi:hypothetical protein